MTASNDQAPEQGELLKLADELRPFAAKTLGSIRIDVGEVAMIVRALDSLATSRTAPDAVRDVKQQARELLAKQLEEPACMHGLGDRGTVLVGEALRAIEEALHQTQQRKSNEKPQGTDRQSSAGTHPL